MAELANRLTGSSDLYQADGRRPSASINFIVAHDGFSLNDLVSYNEKHNEANGEDNNDGATDNESWNLGVEGPTDDPEISELRERQKRNFLATLFFSQGVPMLCGGDELGRTQHGNNNAYCQDDEISWFDWELDERRSSLLDYTAALIAYRRAHPNLHRRKFIPNPSLRHDSLENVVWLRADGQEMSDDDWSQPWMKSIGLFLNGETIGDVDERGERVVDDSFLMLLNCHTEGVEITLPEIHGLTHWETVFDTRRTIVAAGEVGQAGETVILDRQTFMLYKAVAAAG